MDKLITNKHILEAKKKFDMIQMPERANYYCTLCNMRPFRTKTGIIKHFREDHDIHE